MSKPNFSSEAVPQPLIALIDRFASQADAYTSGRYNETQLRRDFLDEFWRLLGWDVTNEQGFAQAYRDVIHEDSIKVGGATKAPDYCFRIGGMRKFFVEAKKPSVPIASDRAAAFQLRRYAWSAKLPISVLTNFAELSIYDTRVKPSADDAATSARLFYFTYNQLSDNWHFLAKVLSKSAVLNGDFDKFAVSTKAKRGTLAVDDAFLDEIETWRKDLAFHLATKNPRLSERELNYAVQQTIDRVIFLRICEDRGIEDYGRLAAASKADRVYPHLVELFSDADRKYNSGLFHFTNESGRQELHDELTPGLVVEDRPLKTILRRLYYPDSPYEFSVLPADILGQVYERFLGKVIRLTKGHQAVVEDKPEVRKAGGVYYTPTHVVNYIVHEVLGSSLVGKTPQQVAKLRIVDPACGSGSFLIAAFQFLLDWHRAWYAGNNAEKWAKGSKPALVQSQIGGWRLSIGERKRILS